ncbi:Piso0_001231 [Millerozyma farinosa CBS 7064]|uniref:Piso0_001231 protein n=1 Tax=Pichia sorbitophila (strain ATCC MYA-4447 / BCRC 22081 / CBS 7064 / NBRC 10061 / NRRL Y-12695) TaxID=559304 RepID=G8YML5_PICSO|nr:Piso0_001231 [Millerozyma farinosa CBS 7064]
MVYPNDFESVAIFNNNYKEPKLHNFEPKRFDEKDVDIEIECCGVCGSDHHAASGNWGNVEGPMVVGHEIVGKVVKVGPQVTSREVGERVGVSAQVLSCFNCDSCKSRNYAYCPKSVLTYNSPYEDGYISKGGYASHIRVHEHFTFNIPESLPSEQVAPFLCGGITAFTPLLQHGIGPGKKVAICGIGGIGHFGILLAKALGGEVYAISRSDAKRKDTLTLGADHYISTADKNWSDSYKRTFDLILLTGSSFSGIDLHEYLSLAKAGGTLHSICGPPSDEMIAVNSLKFIFSGVNLSSSLTGSHENIYKMLQLIADKKIKPWIETISMSEKGVSEALQRVENNQVRYRFVLTDYDKAFTSK